MTPDRERISSSPIVMLIVLIFIFCLHSCLCGERSYIDVEPCDSNRCRLPYCYCSNQTIPGGLKIRDTPQFISITINGPIDKRTYRLLKEIFFSNNYHNPDGLFVYELNSMCLIFKNPLRLPYQWYCFSKKSY